MRNGYVDKTDLGTPCRSCKRLVSVFLSWVRSGTKHEGRTHLRDSQALHGGRAGRWFGCGGSVERDKAGERLTGDARLQRRRQQRLHTAHLCRTRLQPLLAGLQLLLPSRCLNDADKKLEELFDDLTKGSLASR